MCSRAIGVLLALGVAACTGSRSGPDLDRARAEILALHRRSVDAHWNKDVGFLTRDVSDEFFSVGDGEIRKPSRQEMARRFTDYLENTTFTEYRDLQDPVVGISDDGSLAWSLVQVKVAGRQMTDDGGQREIAFTCAWITVYERRGGKWIRRGEVSSFR